VCTKLDIYVLNYTINTTKVALTSVIEEIKERGKVIKV